MFTSRLADELEAMILKEGPDTIVLFSRNLYELAVSLYHPIPNMKIQNCS